MPRSCGGKQGSTVLRGYRIINLGSKGLQLQGYPRPITLHHSQRPYSATYCKSCKGELITKPRIPPPPLTRTAAAALPPSPTGRAPTTTPLSYLLLDLAVPSAHHCRNFRRTWPPPPELPPIYPRSCRIPIQLEKTTALCEVNKKNAAL